MAAPQFEFPEGPDLMPGYPAECFRRIHHFGNYAPLHWHHFAELIYVCSGSQDVTAGNHIEHLRGGDLIYINPEQPHLAYSCDRRTTDLIVLKFTPELLCPQEEYGAERHFLAPLLDTSGIQSLVFRKSELPEQTAQILGELVEIFRRRPAGCEFMCRVRICRIAELLAGLLAERSGHVVSGSPLPRQELGYFRSVLALIEENYAQNLSVASLAALCHLSYSNFAVKFRRLTGKTPVEYINCVRISHAQELLSTTALTVGEIAGRCGFGDICYFSRIFHQFTGQSPMNFRRSVPQSFSPFPE